MKYLNTISLIICLLITTAWQVNGFAGNVFPGTQLVNITENEAYLPTHGETQEKAGIINYREQPEGAFLGVYSDGVSAEKAEKLGSDNPYGSYVTSVIGNTAAEKAGLLPFDYIYGIDEYRTGAEQNLIAILRLYKPNDEATVYFIRQGKKKKIETTFGRRSDARPIKRSECEDPFLGVSQTGKSSLSGVRVNIVENSTAAKIGMPNGAVITHINGYRIYDWTDMSIAIDMLKIGEMITVDYFQEGNNQTASGPIKSYCETKSRTNTLFDWDFDFDFNKRKEKNETYTRRDVAGMQIEVSPIPSSEAAALKTKIKHDLGSKDNLSIEDLTMMAQSESGLFRLQFELPNRGETDIRIYNNSGRAIYEYDLGSFSGKFNDDINLAQNGPGNYYLWIRQGSKTLSRKITLGNK